MNEATHRYFLLNKPAGMVSQFISDSPKHTLLGSLPFRFPEGTHAIGRLDKDSEGLLLLTTNKKITGLLFHSSKKHFRTYLVMVKYLVDEPTLQHLRKGVAIKLKAETYYQAIPYSIERVEDPLLYYPYAQDERVHYPHSWLLITLTEGKYRQIRKMVLSVKHRCLRLIRLSIEEVTVAGIKPGEVKEIEERDFFQLLKISASDEMNSAI